MATAPASLYAAPLSVDLRAYVGNGVRVHPRVAYQSLFTGSDIGAALAQALPALPSYRSGFAGALTVVDWDHRLPSRQLVLRVHGYYTASTLDAGQEAFDDRLEQIAERDRYPEFDVPDFEGLPADEAYEAELSLDGKVGRCRLTSAWRRTISTKDGAAAVAAVSGNSEYKKLLAGSGQRPTYLGDLEAVSWTPPCETDHPIWTLDVWYLLAFDGRLGTGRSFLVDLNKTQVVSVRDFSVRTA